MKVLKYCIICKKHHIVDAIDRDHETNQKVYLCEKTLRTFLE